MAKAAIAYEGFRESIAPLVAQMKLGSVGGVGQTLLQASLIAKEVLSALADIDRAVQEIMTETTDNFEACATEALAAGALAVGAVAIGASAREITKRRKERIDLQEKGYAAEGLKVLKEAARKAKESEMLAKKPKLSAEERLSRIEERPVAPLPAGKAELKKLEIEQLANRVENKASAADEITLALGDGELVSGPLEKALQMDAGTAEVLNAKESDEAGEMLERRWLAVLGYADADELRGEAGGHLLALINEEKKKQGAAELRGYAWDASRT